MDEKEILTQKYKNALMQLGNVSDAYFTALAHAELLAARVAELEKQLAEKSDKTETGDLD